MSATRFHVFVAGSKTLVCTRPAAVGLSTSPPMTNGFPSDRNAWPAQNRLLDVGTSVVTPVAGSSTLAPAPDSKYRTFEEPGSSSACCITFGSATGASQAPVRLRGSETAVTVALASLLAGPALPA